MQRLFLANVGAFKTGKTMAAQVLANELNLELYKVDLSGVLSKIVNKNGGNTCKFTKNMIRYYRCEKSDGPLARRDKG